MTDYEKTKPEFTVYFDEQAIRDHCEASGISLDGLTAEQIRQAGLMAADDFEGDPLVWTAFNNTLQDALREVRDSSMTRLKGKTMSTYPPTMPTVADTGGDPDDHSPDPVYAALHDIEELLVTDTTQSHSASELLQEIYDIAAKVMGP